MYEQNVNDLNNSVLIYKVITFQPSHNQGFTESVLYIFMSFSWVLPGIGSPGIKESRSLCASTQESAILYCWC